MFDNYKLVDIYDIIVEEIGNNYIFADKNPNNGYNNNIGKETNIDF